MKLRTRSGSIRLRLTQAEVASVARGAVVEEVVDIAPAAAFIYRLVASELVGVVTARFEDATLVIEVPAELARAWASSERVGIEGTQAIEGRAPLTILVEKDFACLAPRAEDEDAFPNPAAAARGARC